MQIEELKEALKTEVKASDTWLQNQYPAYPKDRLSEKTFMNFQNIEDCFGIKPRKKIETAVAEHPEIRVVVVAVLDKQEKVRGPRSFCENEADYYGQYELFACSAGMDGFVEVFHNIKRQN